MAVWQSGRAEALAVAPGLPSIQAQEKRDRVNPGTYQRLDLVSQGTLRIADGLRVQPPALLWEAIVSQWGTPGSIYAIDSGCLNYSIVCLGGCLYSPDATVE